jgi:hypothetical protein
MMVRLLVAAGGTVLVVALGYAMALAGEPRSLWLFRDVLGAF